jgi:hypothetical protein
LGLGAAVDDSAEEYLNSVTDNLVRKNLLGSFAPLIIAVCTNDTKQFNDPMVRSSAVIALCKYMCVSDSFWYG